MFKCLFGRDSGFRVIYKDAAEKVKKLFVERGCGRDEVLFTPISPGVNDYKKKKVKIKKGGLLYLKLFHGFHIFSRRSRCLSVKVIEFGSTEKSTRY